MQPANFTRQSLVANFQYPCFDARDSVRNRMRLGSIYENVPVDAAASMPRGLIEASGLMSKRVSESFSVPRYVCVSVSRLSRDNQKSFEYETDAARAPGPPLAWLGGPLSKEHDALLLLHSRRLLRQCSNILQPLHGLRWANRGWQAAAGERGAPEVISGRTW